MNAVTTLSKATGPIARPRADIRTHAISRHERVIVFGPGEYFNVNLRTLHDALWGSPHPDDKVHFQVEDGAFILSSDTSRPACTTGVWPRAKRGAAWAR